MLIAAQRAIIDGEVHSDVAIDVDAIGRIERIGQASAMGTPDVNLTGRVIMPGFVNAHSHAFQRLLRGRTQVAGPVEDSFWTWRNAMYQVAAQLDPVNIYIASRQAFTEMLLSGITCVGEFHYVHHQADGTPYDDVGAMGDAVARAAVDAGIRLCMLRVIYLRGDFDKRPEDLQRRFCDPSIDEAWKRIEALFRQLQTYNNPLLTWGVAAHSLRAVPPDAVVAIKTCVSHLPFHIHVSEQAREVEGCIAKYGASPIALLARQGSLDAETTLIHATHLRAGDAAAIEDTGATVCVCPTTEADLGDGLVQAADLHGRGIPLALGTDGQTQCSILEEARRLEMNERLRAQRRNVLAATPGTDVSKTLLQAATADGARALDVFAGRLKRGFWADLVAFDLEDPSLAGWTDDSLLASILFSAESRAISDVMVGGRFVVDGGHHDSSEESAHNFRRIVDTIFSS